MNKQSIVIGIVFLIAVGGYFFPQIGSQAFGAIGTWTNYFGVSVAQFRVGTNCDDGFSNSCTGTTITRLNDGFCFIQAYATTIAATSTAVVDCQATAAVGGVTTALDTALAGVTAGDKVVVTLATSTAGTASGGLVITGASASSTAGYIQINIANLTGATFTWPTTGTATGTASYIVIK